MEILGAIIIKLIFHSKILILKNSYIKFLIYPSSLQLSTKVASKKVSSIAVIVEGGKKARIDVNYNGYNTKNSQTIFESLIVVRGHKCEHEDSP